MLGASLAKKTGVEEEIMRKVLTVTPALMAGAALAQPAGVRGISSCASIRIRFCRRVMAANRYL
jgi:hypothetical protein